VTNHGIPTSRAMALALSTAIRLSTGCARRKFQMPTSTVTPWLRLFANAFQTAPAPTAGRAPTSPAGRDSARQPATVCRLARQMSAVVLVGCKFRDDSKECMLELRFQRQTVICGCGSLVSPAVPPLTPSTRQSLAPTDGGVITSTTMPAMMSEDSSTPRPINSNAGGSSKSQHKGSDFIGCAGCPSMIVMEAGHKPTASSGWAIVNDQWHCVKCAVAAALLSA